MDLIGGYASDSSNEEQQTQQTPVATATATNGQAAGRLADRAHSTNGAVSFGVRSAPPAASPSSSSLPVSGFSLAALLPAASSTRSAGDLDVSLGGGGGTDEAATREHKKRRKAEKAEKRERKRAKAEAAADATATAATAGIAAIPAPAAPMALPVASVGLAAMLPPPKFANAPPARPSFMQATPYAKPAPAAAEETAAVDVELAAAAAAQPQAEPSSVANVTTATTAPTEIPAPASTSSAGPPAPPTAAAPRLPPGMRAPPGMKAPAAAPSPSPSPDPVASSTSAAASTGASASGSASASASYADALSAAAAVAADAGLSSADSVQQERYNAPLAARERQRLQLLQEDTEPYVPLSLRGGPQSKKGAAKGDQFFRRAGVSGAPSSADIAFLSVNQSDLTSQSLSEQLASQFEERAPAPGSDQVKVAAKFWNTQLGAEEQRTELTRLSKTKHQINALATNAAALEIELQRQRAASYAKRDAARARYGF